MEPLLRSRTSKAERALESALAALRQGAPPEAVHAFVEVALHELTANFADPPNDPDSR